ncbi:MAG: hypothetical protein PHY48_04420 [Candidatus Cloacimonetes bacterium]|nr:hypothetical protein [Candidatus Cloacimonadota bacterium]
MKPRFTPILVAVLFVTAFLLVSCFDSNTEPENPPTDVSAANVLAREGMTILNQTIIDLGNNQPDINSSEDLMQQTTFDSIESKFTAALAVDANNPMANLGMSILSIVEINYDNELWTMLDDAGLINNSPRRIINNQFQFLASAPLCVVNQIKGAKTDPMSIMRVQNFIRNNVLPKLDNAITRLDKAVAMADSTSLMIEVDNEEMVEIDCGEIYAFRAATNAVKAAFNFMVAYDMDMTDPNGGYSWQDDIQNIEEPQGYSYGIYDHHIDGTILYLEYRDDWYAESYVQSHSMEIMMKTMKWNLDNSATFGKLTSTGVASLNAAKAAILSAAADVKLGTNSILAETDDQTNDIIKIENINSINAEFPFTDDDTPAFAQTWQNVNDISDWLTTVMNSTYALTLNGVDFSVNVGAFFNGAILDIEDYIPFLQWNDPAIDWVEDSIDYEHGWTPYNNSYSFYENGVYITVNNISYVRRRDHDFDLNWGNDLDDQGNVIYEYDVPYFPDYTFNGVLPGMTRAKMLLLHG